MASEQPRVHCADRMGKRPALRLGFVTSEMIRVSGCAPRTLSDRGERQSFAPADALMTGQPEDRLPRPSGPFAAGNLQHRYLERDGRPRYIKSGCSHEGSARASQTRPARASIAIGPGKAALLEAIGETGSIAAAARRMGMSYRRAWVLAKTMNACFRDPLIEAAKGGIGGGGARLTRMGREVLALYRAMEDHAAAAVISDLNKLRALMVDEPPED